MAASHVDRSIEDPFSFVQTNVMGTLSLLQAVKNYWNNNYSDKLFYNFSNDEVYASLGQEGFFTEKTNYDPHLLYSASKASSDYFIRAIDVIFRKGKLGDTYNIGGFEEWENIDLIKVMIKTVDPMLGREEESSEKLITYVTDRVGHDLRYAIDFSKLKNEFKMGTFFIV